MGTRPIAKAVRIVRLRCRRILHLARADPETFTAGVHNPRILPDCKAVCVWETSSCTAAAAASRVCYTQLLFHFCGQPSISSIIRPLFVIAFNFTRRTPYYRCAFFLRSRGLLRIFCAECLLRMCIRWCFEIAWFLAARFVSL